MTAGTVVITGGILATVILLCIIAVLCYCRLQVRLGGGTRPQRVLRWGEEPAGPLPAGPQGWHARSSPSVTVVVGGGLGVEDPG